MAYKLNECGFISKIGNFCSNEEVSYFAGWLGDATIAEDNGTTSFGDDDYCADLDAENIYRHIILGYSFVDAFSKYYCSITDTNNRATVFLSYISYETVCNKVYYELIDRSIMLAISEASRQGDTALVSFYNDLLNDESYHLETLRTRYYDTYNFILSLQDCRANMRDY